MSGVTELETKEQRLERLRKEEIRRAAKTLRESYLALLEEGFTEEEARAMAWTSEE